MDKTIGTVCFIVFEGKILLAEIEYPDGKHLWNGIGGVVEPDETPSHAVVREISEETELKVNEAAVREIKVINIGNLELHVFVTANWQGELIPTDTTLKKLRWFMLNEVPYTQMHTGNDEWLPDILQASQELLQ